MIPTTTMTKIIKKNGLKFLIGIFDIFHIIKEIKINKNKIGIEYVTIAEPNIQNENRSFERGSNLCTNESDLTYSIIITSPIKLRLLSYYPFYNLSNYLLEM